MKEERKILTWKEVARLATPEIFSFPREISNIITLARQKGIGKQISYQKTLYFDKDINLLSVIIKWWVNLNASSNNEWRDTKTSKMLYERVIDSVISDKPLILFAIFCPSYKIGIGAYGYNKNVGIKTRKSISFFSRLVSESRKAGLKIRAIAYFSDLILENLEKLWTTEYKSDLKNNYQSFVKEFFDCSGGQIETPLLSSVKECLEEIGEAGIAASRKINKDIYDRVLKRNAIFYEDKLGWEYKDVLRRTDIIFGSYLKLSEIFHKKFPQGIMIWAESAYERGLIYGVQQSSIIPIIYPRNAGILDFFKDREVEVLEINLFSDRIKDFIEGLYEEEPVPIFEHSLCHITSYLGYDYKIYGIKCSDYMGVIGVKDNIIIIFTPRVFSFNGLKEMIRNLKDDFPSSEIRIQNVSQYWVEKYKNNFEENWTMMTRSKEEVVYDVDVLNELRGGDFSNLRNIRNKFVGGGVLKFKAASKVNIDDIDIIIDKWQTIQGDKYLKNKQSKERHVCRKFIELAEKFPDSYFAEIGYFENRPISFYIMHRAGRFRGWGVLYSVKGLNKEEGGGIHGVSDATYLHCFVRAGELGIKYLNDGELGVEQGTRQHKLKFRPCMFLQSFDVIIN